MVESLIAAGAAILVCLLNNWYMDKRRGAENAATMAVISEKIETLSERVERHNKVIERVYQLEAHADDIARRVDKLEG